MEFSITVLSTYFAAVAGLLAAVLGLIGMAYIFQSSNDGREVDRAMQKLVQDISAAAEKHADQIGELTLALSDMTALKKVLRETFGEIDPALTGRMVDLCTSVESDIDDATRKSIYFRCIVILCAAGLAMSLVGLIFSEAMSAMVATVAVGLVGLVTLSAVVIICIFFFMLTRQRFSYWT